MKNPRMAKKEERRNPKEGVFPPKPNPKQVSNTYIYMKWKMGQLWAKNVKFVALAQCSSLRRSHVSSFCIVSLRLGEGLLRLGEPKSHLLMRPSLVAAKDSFVATNFFATVKGILTKVKASSLLA